MSPPLLTITNDPERPGCKKLIGFPHYDAFATRNFPLWNCIKKQAADVGLTEQDRLKLTCVGLMNKLVEVTTALHSQQSTMSSLYRDKWIEPGH